MPQPHDFRIREEMECTPAQLFAIISDVDRYSEFLPFCTSSKVIQRQSDTRFNASLTLGFLGFSEVYTSHVSLQPTSLVEAKAADGSLFCYMHTKWRLSEGERPGTCKLDFRLEMQLKSIVHDHALKRVLDSIASQQVKAFKKRCSDLYGFGSSRGGGGVASTERNSSAQDEQGVGNKESGGSRQVNPRIQVEQTLGSKSRTQETGRPISTEAGDQLSAPKPVLQVDPSWRRKVEAAFDTHQVTKLQKSSSTKLDALA